MFGKPTNEPPLLQPITDQPSVPGLDGFVRLSGSPTDTNNALGPLADLVGTWVGNTGWNMIALPQDNDFILLVRPYVETITFAALGAPVPDRQGQGNPTLFISGLSYELHVSDAETNQPMHLENGMWLLLNQDEKQDPGNPSISRHSIVPHGDSLAALGNYSTIEGPPPISDRNGVPDPGPDVLPGYLDAYGEVKAPFEPTNTVSTLQSVLAGQKVRKTTTMSVDTNNSGGIVNIPFVVKHANASRLQCIFWIETVVGPDGSDFLQLQYFQQTDLNFLPTFGGPPGSLIMWPHTNVNTLVKQ